MAVTVTNHSSDLKIELTTLLINSFIDLKILIKLFVYITKIMNFSFSVALRLKARINKMANEASRCPPGVVGAAPLEITEKCNQCRSRDDVELSMRRA